MEPVYKRVLLKVSGEALAGEGGRGFSEETVMGTCAQIREILDMGVEVAVVIGGGNFWRGRTSGDMDRPTADSIGMLATVMNSLYLQDGLRRSGVKAKVMTSIAMEEVADQYTIRGAREELEKGTVVILAGGTGHPYFSTDTAAALRAIEIEADVILFAKNIDGVYSADPAKDPTATKYDALTHLEVLEKNLQVMDMTAAALCRDNGMAIHVFGLAEEGNIRRAVMGEAIGTIIR